MTSYFDEKQIAIRLNEDLIARLDSLAGFGEMKRNHLMLSFVNIWLSVLEKSEMAHVFYAANILRVHEFQMTGGMGAYEHEFTESRPPEKPFPIKLTKEDIFNIYRFANFSHISNHLLLKTMIIVGIEELEKLTDDKPYQLGTIEPQLYKSFAKIMEKGFKAFKAYIK